MARFKLFPRYRRPSVRTLLGITQAERRIKRESGYYAATRLFRTPTNMRRRMLRRAGYYSPTMMFLRWALGRHRR
jgi:hypothetical protein